MSPSAPRRPAPTLRTFLRAQWLPAIKNSIRETTFVNYRSHVERHLIPRLGSRRLDRIDGPLLTRTYAELLESGRSFDNGGLSRGSVRRIHATIHRALQDAVRWGHIERNPAALADPPKLHADAPFEMRTWSADELRVFLTATRNETLNPLWVVLATTGMRRGEALGLRWTDLDLEQLSLAVRQTIVSVGHGIRISRPKSARGRRVIALDARTIEALVAHERKRPSDSDLVFCGPDGRALHPTTVSKVFVRTVKTHGLPRIRLHDLRHTHATLALQAGVHPKIVSERLGHSSVAFTLEVYSHALPSLQKEAADRIANVVFGPRQGGRLGTRGSRRDKAPPRRDQQHRYQERDPDQRQR